MKGFPRIPAALSALIATVFVLLGGAQIARSATTGLSSVISGGAYAATTAAAGFESAAQFTQVSRLATISGLTVGNIPKATSATATTWGALDPTVAGSWAPSGGNWSAGGGKITSVANGTAATDVMAFGQFTFTTVNALIAAANASIAVNNQKLTGLAAGTAAGDSVRWEQSDRAITDWQNTNTGSTSADRFISSNQAATNPATTESTSQVIMPLAGSVRALYIALLTAGTSTDSQVFAVRINGVDTTLTCNLAQGVQTCNDTAHSASFNAGDKISVRVTQSGTENKAVGMRAAVAWRQ